MSRRWFRSHLSEKRIRQEQDLKDLKTLDQFFKDKEVTSTNRSPIKGTLEPIADPRMTNIISKTVRTDTEWYIDFE
jgi:hypothetical protein